MTLWDDKARDVYELIERYGPQSTDAVVERLVGNRPTVGYHTLRRAKTMPPIGGKFLVLRPQGHERLWTLSDDPDEGLVQVRSLAWGNLATTMTYRGQMKHFRLALTTLEQVPVAGAVYGLERGLEIVSAQWAQVIRTVTYTKSNADARELEAMERRLARYESLVA
jgi:hypothetical protein